jgi:hypothetical protein
MRFYLGIALVSLSGKCIGPQVPMIPDRAEVSAVVAGRALCPSLPS